MTEIADVGDAAGMMCRKEAIEQTMTFFLHLRRVVQRSSLDEFWASALGSCEKMQRCWSG